MIIFILNSATEVIYILSKKVIQLSLSVKLKGIQNRSEYTEPN